MYEVNQEIEIGNTKYIVLGQSEFDPTSNHAKYAKGNLYLKKAENGRIIFHAYVGHGGNVDKRVFSTGISTKLGIEKLVEIDASVGRR